MIERVTSPVTAKKEEGVMRVSLRHFSVFIAVAETGQVSKAAAALFTSQPAVTEAIKTLETDVGVKLFNRTPRGGCLTYEFIPTELV